MSNEYPAGYTPMTDDDFREWYERQRKVYVSDAVPYEDVKWWYGRSLERAVLSRLPKPDTAERDDFRKVRFVGIDPLNIGSGAIRPMIPDSWRFDFIALPDGNLQFSSNDKGKLVAFDAVATADTAERDDVNISAKGVDEIENRKHERDMLVARISCLAEYWVGEFESETQRLLRDIRAHLAGGVE